MEELNGNSKLQPIKEDSKKRKSGKALKSWFKGLKNVEKGLADRGGLR